MGQERNEQTPALLSLAEKKMSRCSECIFILSLSHRPYCFYLMLVCVFVLVCALLCALAVPVGPHTGLAHKLATYFCQQLSEVDIRTKRRAVRDGEGRLVGCRSVPVLHSGLWINYPAPKPDPALRARQFGITPDQ